MTRRTAPLALDVLRQGAVIGKVISTGTTETFSFHNLSPLLLSVSDRLLPLAVLSATSATSTPSSVRLVVRLAELTLADVSLLCMCASMSVEGSPGQEKKFLRLRSSGYFSSRAGLQQRSHVRGFGALTPR